MDCLKHSVENALQENDRDKVVNEGESIGVSWSAEKERIKVLTDELQRMCDKIGSPISLTVAPNKKRKTIALFNQPIFKSEFEGDYYFMFIRMA